MHRRHIDVVVGDDVLYISVSKFKQSKGPSHRAVRVLLFLFLDPATDSDCVTRLRVCISRDSCS